jgi:hypothetical protein
VQYCLGSWPAHSWLQMRMRRRTYRAQTTWYRACQNFLAHRNTSLVDLVDQGICVGTLNGLSYLTGYLPPDLSSCVPEGVTTGQKIRVVLVYIQRRPQRMHEDFQDLAIEAFHEAWPCKAVR